MLRKSATIPKKDTRTYQPLNSAFGAEFNEVRQQFNIDRWCHQQGIDRHTLETHPCVSDIRTLLDFDKLDSLMTDRDRKIWTHAWKWVYKKQLPINPYIEKGLLSIVKNCQRVELIQQRRQRQAARQGTATMPATMGL
jgi:hypothetical protein